MIKKPTVLRNLVLPLPILPCLCLFMMRRCLHISKRITLRHVSTTVVAGKYWGWNSTATISLVLPPLWEELRPLFLQILTLHCDHTHFTLTYVLMSHVCLLSSCLCSHPHPISLHYQLTSVGRQKDRWCSFGCFCSWLLVIMGLLTVQHWRLLLLLCLSVKPSTYFLFHVFFSMCVYFCLISMEHWGK